MHTLYIVSQIFLFSKLFNPNTYDIVHMNLYAVHVCVCVHMYVYGLRISVFLISEAPRGEIVVLAEEVMDSKYTISMQLSAAHLDKKDFFGKVCAD